MLLCRIFGCSKHFSIDYLPAYHKEQGQGVYCVDSVDIVYTKCVLYLCDIKKETRTQG